MAELLNGEYELGRRLGGGAEGDVFEATSIKTQRKVAVKIIKRPAHDIALLESIKKLKDSRVPSCPAVLDVFALDGRLVTILELVDGMPLKDFLGQSLGPGRRKTLAHALIHAVKELHDEGLVHGDLSPGNVFVERRGKVKLIDPRIAAHPGSHGALGTANYTPPESLHYGSAPNACGDVFSLCALIYEVFEAQDPFGTQSNEEYVIKAGARSLSARPFNKTPKAFRRMLAAGLELDPRARPKTVASLLVLLDTARKRLSVVIGVLALAAIVACVGWYLRAASALDSIAVLPFVNEDKNPEGEYLADGLTDSLTNALTQLPRVRVSPRCQVAKFAGGAADPLAAARELGVRAVVTGRLSRLGDHVEVGVELLDARERKQLWGDRYGRDAADALLLQKDISRRVFDSLRARINGVTQKRLASRGTESTEAYDAYLKGRYFWNRRTADNIQKSLDQFRRAVAADPGYALAYIGLADSYALLEQYAGISSAESLPKAREAAMTALKIDDTLTEAHASLGYIDLMSWRFADSELEFKRALALDPLNPVAHAWYGALLHVLGRYDEALAQARLSQEEDPLTPIFANLPCNVHLFTQQIPLAIEECSKVFDLDPNFPRTHDLLGWAYMHEGRIKEGLVELEKAARFSGRASQELGYLGYGYGRAGRKDEALALARELEGRFAVHRSPGMFIAAVYAGLGDKDKAFAWLERDFAARSGTMVYITFFPVYDTLRDDPRYADLLRRMGMR